MRRITAKQLDIRLPGWRGKLPEWMRLGAVPGTGTGRPRKSGEVVHGEWVDFPDGFDPLAPPPRSKAAAIIKAAPAPRTPPKRLSDEEIALGEEHAKICEGCKDQCKGVTRTRNVLGDPHYPVYIVSCKLGGCGGVRLTVRGNCAAGKW